MKMKLVFTYIIIIYALSFANCSLFFTSFQPAEKISPPAVEKISKKIVEKKVVAKTPPKIINKKVVQTDALKILPDWQTYETQYDLACYPPLVKVRQPKKVEIGGKTYLFEGSVLRVLNQDQDDRAVLGVLSATKDYFKASQRNVRYFLREFKRHGVEAIVMNGDIAYEEEDLKYIIEDVAAISKLPVFVQAGNSESAGNMSMAVLDLQEKLPNLINMSLVKFVDGDDYDLLSLPGYYNKKYTHNTGSCIYWSEHFLPLGQMVKFANDPLVFVSHGPPRTPGKNGIDMIPDGTHVGDIHISEFLQKHQIKFGIFGHILEAGGKGCDLSGETYLSAGKWHDSLYVNAGSSSSVPWKMNNGTVSKGMAMIYSIKGKKAMYKLLKAR